jgi:hypothetical protein
MGCEMLRAFLLCIAMNAGALIVLLIDRRVTSKRPIVGTHVIGAGVLRER